MPEPWEGPDGRVDLARVDLSGAVGAAVEDFRRLYRLAATPGEWYVVFPYWLVCADGRTVERFAVEFEESARRMAWMPNLPVGFEVDAPGGVYRYRLSWLGGENPATTPEEETA